MYNLTPTQVKLQAEARDLAQSVFAPTAANTDLTEQYPWDNVAALRDAGFMGMTLPTSVGGRGLSYLDTVVVIEEMAKACATMGRITVEANMGAIGVIAKYGTAEQLGVAAELVLAGDKPAICISEPDAGSAATEMTTRADKQGDYYVLNGEKYWITGGGVSKLHLIFARVFEDGVDQGIGGFICVRNETDPNELVVGRRLYAMGVRGIPETHLEFHNLKIHKSMLVTLPGGLKRGFATLMNAYNAQRVGAGTVALGIAQSAFDDGLDYLKSRHQFGRPIAEFQGLQWMLADMSTQLEAARLMLRAAAVSGVDFPDITQAARAKIFAADTANKVTNDALQFYGSSGYGRDHPMERHVRNARMFTIAGGSAQILRTQVASKLLDMKLPQTRDGYMKRSEQQLSAV